MTAHMQLARLPRTRRSVHFADSDSAENEFHKNPFMPSEFLARLHQENLITLTTVFKPIDEDFYHLYPNHTVLVRHNVFLEKQKIHLEGFGAADNVSLAIESAAFDVVNIVINRWRDLPEIAFPKSKLLSRRIEERLKTMCFVNCKPGCTGYKPKNFGSNFKGRFKVSYFHGDKSSESSGFHPQQELAELKAAYRADTDNYSTDFARNPINMGPQMFKSHWYTCQWQYIDTLKKLNVRTEFRLMPANFKAFCEKFVAVLANESETEDQDDDVLAGLFDAEQGADPQNKENTSGTDVASVIPSTTTASLSPPTDAACQLPISHAIASAVCATDQDLNTMVAVVEEALSELAQSQKSESTFEAVAHAAHTQFANTIAESVAATAKYLSAKERTKLSILKFQNAQIDLDAAMQAATSRKFSSDQVESEQSDRVARFHRECDPGDVRFYRDTIRGSTVQQRLHAPESSLSHSAGTRSKHT